LGQVATPFTVLNVESLDKVYDFIHCAANVVTRAYNPVP
jgi:hypothetical protein